LRRTRARARFDPLAAEDDDLLGAETLGGDHPAQADSTVADDGRDLAGTNAGDNGRMLAGPHHVGQRQQRGHERVVFADRERKQRAVGEGHPHRLRLGCAGAVAVEEPAVHAGRVQALVAEGAGAIGEGKRHQHEVADLDVAHVRADVVDEADRLMAHRPPGLGRLQGAIRPEVAPADGRPRDPDDGIGGLNDRGIGDILDSDVACLIHQRRSHWLVLSLLAGAASREAAIPRR
jgi:hypothetical protein